jgi:hypothetical protein
LFFDPNTNLTDREVLGNYLEGAFWTTVGVILFLCGRKAKPDFKRLSIWASVLFVLFGISDFVEAQTGAWWRPWWLLIWKGLCIAGLAWCYWKYREARKTSGKAQLTSPPPVDRSQPDPSL